MSYLVLARKWRPQTFHDLIGQDHVRRTLENAIAQDRVAHAFLFTGVRGVGKTTSARILAKALNCERGPTASPCLQCAPCRDIAAGADIDVRELDGASNNGVEDVRKLQEELPYRPSRDRFKIYIVDEVHMLSTGAWNAFLKTLEEPPPHVKFIFATTEVHKVPITILSRCQRYDFRMISAQMIATRIRFVLEQEKVTADDAAINLIAREAAGSMRDAMSLLDQAIAWSSEKLAGDEVAQVLGVASHSTLHQLAVSLVGGQPEAALRLISQLAENGYDLGQVARDLLSILRDLIVAKVCHDPGPLLDLSEEERRATTELASRTTSDDLIRLHQGFARSFDDIVRSPSPRAGLEITLVRLARRPPLVPLDDLLSRLADLERRLGGGPSSGPPAGPSPNTPRSSGGRPPPVSSGSTAPVSPSRVAPSSPAIPPRIAPPPSSPQVSATPTSFAPRHPGPTALAASPPTVANPSPAVLAAMRRVAAPALQQDAAPAQRADNIIRPVFPSVRTPQPETDTPAPHSAPSRSALSSHPTNVHSSVPSQPPTQTARPTNVHPSSRSSAPTSSSHRVRPQPGALAHDPSKPLPTAFPGVDFAVWRSIVEQARKDHPALASILELASPHQLGPTGLTLSYPPNSFEVTRIKETRYAEPLAQLIHSQLGPETSVSIHLSEQASHELTLSKILNAERWERREAAKHRIAQHPLVRAILEELGAELKDIKVSEDSPKSDAQGAKRP